MDTRPFMAPVTPLFWTSGYVSSGFQSQSAQPYSHLAEADVMILVERNLLIVTELVTTGFPCN